MGALRHQGPRLGTAVVWWNSTDTADAAVSLEAAREVVPEPAGPQVPGHVGPSHCPGGLRHRFAALPDGGRCLQLPRTGA